MQTGQFKPANGSNPTIGSIGNLQHVTEDRVEIMLIDRAGGGQIVRDVLKELKSVCRFAVLTLYCVSLN